MLSILIAVIVGALAGTLIGMDLDSVGWGITCGVVGFMLTQLVIGLILRKKIGAIQAQMQQQMMEAQSKMSRQVNLFQQRQPGNLAGARQLAERLQNELARKTLEETARFEPYYKWSPMLVKQINAMKMQLYFQLRDFSEVDRLMAKAMLLDPFSMAIKLVRLYKNNSAELDTFYNKKCAKTKGDALAFLASVYAWMKLRSEEKDKALRALTAAQALSDNAALIENIDRLKNGKEKNFSNAGFGDQWFALGLEEFKPKMLRRKNGGMY